MFVSVKNSHVNRLNKKYQVLINQARDPKVVSNPRVYANMLLEAEYTAQSIMRLTNG